MVPGILGGSKENIEITPSPHEPEKIQVSYGMMPLYEVSADKNAIDFRLMVANLFLRGVKKKEIVERFGVTYVTARKWAEVVESTEDYEELVSKLQGNKRLKKLSPEIIGFIRGRFKALYLKSRKGYNTKIREEVISGT